MAPGVTDGVGNGSVPSRLGTSTTKGAPMPTVTWMTSPTPSLSLRRAPGKAAATVFTESARHEAYSIVTPWVIAASASPVTLKPWARSAAAVCEATPGVPDPLRTLTRMWSGLTVSAVEDGDGEPVPDGLGVDDVDGSVVVDGEELGSGVRRWRCRT